MDDKLILGGKEFSSRLIMGSGKFDHAMIDACVRHAGCEIVTLALRRVNESKSRNILDFIPSGVTLLPNTSGAGRRRAGRWGARRPQGSSELLSENLPAPRSWCYR